MSKFGGGGYPFLSLFEPSKKENISKMSGICKFF